MYTPLIKLEVKKAPVYMDVEIGFTSNKYKFSFDINLDILVKIKLKLGTQKMCQFNNSNCPLIIRKTSITQVVH